MLKTALRLIMWLQLYTGINILLIGKIQCPSFLSMFKLTRKRLIRISRLEPNIKRLQMSATGLVESPMLHISLCNNQLVGLTLLRDSNSNPGLLLKLQQLPLIRLNSNLLLIISEKYLGRLHCRRHLLCRHLWPYILHLN